MEKMSVRERPVLYYYCELAFRFMTSVFSEAHRVPEKTYFKVRWQFISSEKTLYKVGLSYKVIYNLGRASL